MATKVLCDFETTAETHLLADTEFFNYSKGTGA